MKIHNSICYSIFFLFFILISHTVYSQGVISGTVTNYQKRPVPNAQAILVGTKYQATATTDENGSFSFRNIYSGEYVIKIQEPGHFEYSTEIDYIEGENYKLDDIMLEPINASKDLIAELPINTVFDDESNANSNGNDISSLLNAARDPYVNAASFNFSQGGFRIRGYDNYQDIIYINGLPMQNLHRGGDVAFGDFAGLNDVLRSRNTYFGTRAVPFGFGHLATSVDIDAEALNQRKGLRINLMNTNRNFRNRVMATYSSGLLKGGWAYTISGSFRGAKEGYIEGTGFESYAGFVSVSKIWSQKFNTTLTAFGVNTLRAVQGSATQEAYDIKGSNYYNPSWGWQNGEKRSANLRKDMIPSIILSSDWKPNHLTSLVASIGYQFGIHNNIGLDWFNTYNPNPVYYKKLPSYYVDNPVLYQQIYDQYKANPDLLQVQWDDIYDYNRSGWDSVPTRNLAGSWANVLMSGQVQKLSNLTVNTVLNKKINKGIEMHAGLTFQNSLNEQYRQVEDLLGADFFVNINQFAERADPTNPNSKQNDLNNPYQIVKEGDKYGYNYLGRVSKGIGFLQFLFSLDRTDWYIGSTLEYTEMERNGYMKAGAFANNSFGNSTIVNFWNYGFKSGFSYKINGRNYIGANALYMTKPREYNQVFVLPRTANTVSLDLSTPYITSLELNYNLKAPRVKVVSNLYITEARNEANATMFYTEITNSFGNLVLSNIHKRFMGIELAADIQLIHGFSTTIAGTLADHSYILRPKSIFYYDNIDRVEPQDIVYFHDLKLANGPQNAGMLRLNYNSKQFWNASISANFFGKNFAEASPQRRTTEAVDNVPQNSDLYYKILKQEQVDGGMTLDVSWRKSFYINKYIKNLKKRMYLDVNISINNILDKQDLIRNSREQLRFDFRENNPEKYPNRYIYMQGRNYMVMLNFRL